MTLEAGFAYAAAVMEMLLQSWGGTIRLFPTVPDRWHDASFEDLRAEGAFVVSAKLRDGEVLFAGIVSEAGGLCRLRNPWAGGAVIVRAPEGDLELRGEVVEWETVAGAEYLVFAQGREPDAEDLTPTLPARTDSDRHWFGVKRLPRF